MNKNIISMKKEAVTIPSDNFETAEIVTKRTSVRLNNPSKNKSSKREALNGPVIWFDTEKLSDQRPDGSIFIRVINSFYSDIILYPNDFSAFIDEVPKRMQIRLIEAEFAGNKRVNHRKIGDDHGIYWKKIKRK
ncbi:hypothetical protein [Photorhabdus tasmaniensis]|uniref:Uncharacterized protein n=1 Tax=Photorhabdus tasmaniensis TaxID=1004159 RepID=A0ABX0GHI5_9GAMM|nr:hypothetical protein [Photorhabdus tasmaniensis]NHB88639.1 hypothetical protein [Photorhabdus tasmaniensis]